MTAGLPAELHRFIEEQRWTFAHTMPTWPHEYILRKRVDEALFEQLARHIQEQGTEGAFYSRSFIYYAHDSWVYWTMAKTPGSAQLINRCREADTFEARRRAGTLPD